MATYKVLQDIEAEDHILGPLSLRQFIYALICVFFLYISFICLTKHLGVALIITLPPAIFTGFFAFPFGKDQPTEVWALAKIRFLFKPRLRLWDQSGVKELVTITVPKKIERVLTNGLNETEVQSRLQALASTIDSRGWAIKNVNVSMYGRVNPLTMTNSDRLIDISSLPQEVPSYDVQASDDILDERSNPIAQQFDRMISASTQSHRQQLIDSMNSTRQPAAAASPASNKPGQPPANHWFMNQPTPPANLAADQTMFAGAPVAQPGVSDAGVPAQAASADDAALAEQIREHNSSQAVSYSHLRTLQPLNTEAPAASVEVPATPAPAVTPQPDPAILSLANNNDLNVSTLAHEASKAKNSKRSTDSDDEVVISLR